jgi:hypothetical protein
MFSSCSTGTVPLQHVKADMPALFQIQVFFWIPKPNVVDPHHFHADPNTVLLNLIGIQTKIAEWVTILTRMNPYYQSESGSTDQLNPDPNRWPWHRHSDIPHLCPVPDWVPLLQPQTTEFEFGSYPDPNISQRHRHSDILIFVRYRTGIGILFHSGKGLDRCGQCFNNFLRN